VALSLASLVASCAGSSDAPTVAPAPATRASNVTTTSGLPTTTDRTTTTIATSVAPPTTVSGIVGAAGLGDQIYPDLGNGGYDMRHVDLDLRWEQKTGLLAATAAIDIDVADRTLASFNLDFRGFEISSVTVDKRTADFTRNDDELVVTPAEPLAPRSVHTIAVTYEGLPDSIPDTGGRPLGWLTTPTGAYTLAEPNGAHAWFPCNDHPSDKATYTIHVDVAAPLAAVANGTLMTSTEANGRRRVTYDAADPMASYLVIVAVGRFATTERMTPTGLRLRQVQREGRAAPGGFLDITEQQIAFFEKRFGVFPLSSYGLLIIDSVRGLAMETATLSLFSEADMNGGRGDDESFLAHELGHQWFGDAVTLDKWTDIWLNESFATYADWLWSYRDDPRGLDFQAEQERLRAATGRPTTGPTGRPKPDFLFSNTVYNGGAIVLHAYRREVGDDVFFQTLRTWVSTYRGKSASTTDFVTLASQVAGRDLTAFFETWLNSENLPPFPATAAAA
jgi:aminopeptidase N